MICAWIIKYAGVSSVSIEGREKDQVVVVGEGVDSVCLARSLRKKFKSASILSVSEVKKEEKKEEKKPIYYYPPFPPPYLPPYAVYDEYPNYCTIM